MRMFTGWLVTMTTLFAEYTIEEQDCVVCFLWGKGLNAKDIHKEPYPLYGGKCLSSKAVHNSVDKFSQRRSKVADDARPGAEVAQTTVKKLLCCGFRRTDKAIGQVYQCWWRICREINVFLRFEYNMFYILYLFVSYLLILLLIFIMRWEQNRHIGDLFQHKRHLSVSLPTQVMACPQKCLRRTIPRN
jgi:hypothetical protein